MATNNIVDSLLISSTLEVSDTVTFSGTSDFIISSTGNVGIGVATPSTKLEVSGVITATGGTSTNWNTAYGWGDHAAVGYLTSFTETDPVFSASAAAGITSTNISNWNTAYGWGDHSVVGYLTSIPSHTHTDADINSWHNRETINIDTYNPDSNWSTSIASSTSYGTQPNNYTNIHNLGGDGVDYQTQIATYYGNNNRMWVRSRYDGTNAWVGWNEVWTSGSFANNSANWNTAYGWGDHAAAGYLTSYSETDTLATVTNRGSSTTNSITLGGTSTNGSVLAYGTYSNGNIIVLGGMRSSGGPMIGYGLKPDTATSHGFVSSSGATLTRGAYYINGNEHRWYSGGSQTAAVGGAVSVSQSMTLNSSGNLGIGTTSPSYALDIAGSSPVLRLDSTGHASIYIDRGSSSYDANLMFLTAGATKFRLWLDAADALGIRDEANATEMVTFKSGGNVGIGTTSPAQKLHVDQGFIQVQSPDVGGVTPPYVQIGQLTNAYQAGVSSYYHLQLRAGGSGNIYFTEDGNYLMMLSNAGNLGIGTTSPTSKLHVVSANYDAMRIERSSAGGGVALYLENGNNNTWIVGNGGNNHFAINKSTSNFGDEFIILSTGEVGIGTASPSVQLDIEDSGNVLIDLNTTTANANTTIRFQEAGANTATIGYDGTNNGLILTTGSFTANSGIFVNDSGNVGIHTANPSVDLQTGASGASLDTAIRAYHSDGAYTEIRGYGLVTNRTTAYIRPTGDKNATMAIGNDNNTWNYVNVNANYFTVGTDTTEHMRITSAGNVGIGTTSPGSKLTVVDAGNSLTFAQHSTSNIAELKIIGDAAHDAAIYFGDTVDNVRGGFYYDTSANQLQVRGYNNGTRMVVNSNGNVGIGTTSPQGKLHINGLPRIDSAGAKPATSAVGPPDTYIGGPGAASRPNEFLGNPDQWLLIDINGTQYVIPAYQV